MLELKMSRDIKTFEPSIIGPFTLRQIAWITLGAVIAVPLFMVLPGEIPARILICTLIASPFIMCGWIKVQGMYLDGYLKIVLKYMFIDSRVRLNTDMNRMERSLARKHIQYRKRKDRDTVIYR